jgi:outer membrane protein OmpA-like peptidoglycan-associated protein
MRRWIRVDPPLWGFWWRGAIPALLLACITVFAVTRFAHATIESRVRERSIATLAQAGFPWVKVEADGQNLHLTGTLPVGVTGGEAVASVEGAVCETWAGRLPCTRHVTSDFQPAAAPAVEAPAAQWQDIRLLLEGGVLTLTGEVPSDEARQALLDTARQAVDAPRLASVKDALRVVAVPAMAGWRTLATRAIDSITRCQAGLATLVQGEFSLRCDVTKASVAEIDRIARAPVAEGRLGTVLLVTAEEVQACDARFAAALAGRAIQFGTGSAVVAASSQPLLVSIATIAKECPGNLRIEGHTDNVGTPQANQDLSQRRAEGVRDALIGLGIESARLLPQGFGQARPRSSNLTPIGRAQNRRIEFHVTTADR